MNFIQNIIASSVAVKEKLLQDATLIARVQEAADAIIRCLERQGRVYFCGNGGSAADAQHLAAELSGSFYDRGRPALPADALHANTSYLTAAANDFSFGQVYSRLVEGYMKPGDVLVGLSTSGNSENIVQAFQAARKNQVATIGFTGETGGALAALSDVLINVPSNDTPRIQECHILCGHIICQLVEHEIFPPRK